MSYKNPKEYATETVYVPIRPKIFTVWLFIEDVFPALGESAEYENRVFASLRRLWVQ